MRLRASMTWMSSQSPHGRLLIKSRAGDSQKYLHESPLQAVGYNEAATFNDIFQQQRTLDSGSKELPE
ncbi:conserved protein of unknown function [Shewanella benthica]|uniref:Uncharacterized protein n=1 Tax=Shewanella benthica TaxID=43661 RepID=A0A330M2E0_9GAMM|nr:conserved protein of unknown function [Shewanella benthica]